MDTKHFCSGINMSVMACQKNYSIQFLSEGIRSCHKPPEKQQPVKHNAIKSTSILPSLFCSCVGSLARLVILCIQEASRAKLPMKRNGCRVNVIHCGEGIKWDRAEREHRSKGDKSFALKIINAVAILMNSTSHLCHASFSLPLSISPTYREEEKTECYHLAVSEPGKSIHQRRKSRLQLKVCNDKSNYLAEKSLYISH